MTKRLPRVGGRRISTVDRGTGAQIQPTYTVATAPSAAGRTGQSIYISNGAAGSPITAFSDGTNWKRVDTGATAAAT